MVRILKELPRDARPGQDSDGAPAVLFIQCDSVHDVSLYAPLKLQDC